KLLIRLGPDVFEIRIKNDGTADSSLLTSSCDMKLRGPAWLPDGSGYVFAGRGGIFQGDINGQNLRPLIRSEDSTIFGLPTWSPDARMMAYIANGNQTQAWNLYIADVATQRTRQLSFIGQGSRDVRVVHFAWSPDSAGLAYTTLGSAHIYVSD